MDSERRRQLSALLQVEHDWLITSSEAVRNLVQMAVHVAGDAGVKKLQRQKFFLPHVRIEATARELGLTKLILTRPGDAGLLAALQCGP
jgi:uroporphyrinogen-III synthase